MNTIRSIQSLHELDEIRQSWEQWQSHFNNDLAQFELVCRLCIEVEHPVVLVVEDKGQPIALIACRLEQTEFAPSIGYLKPVAFPAKVLAVIHQGVMGTLSNEDAKGCLEHLKLLLQQGLADAVSFHHLSENSPLLTALRGDRSRWLCEKTPRWSTHREMILPRGGDMFGQKLRSKHRTSLRKRQKELDAAYPGKVSWRWFTAFDDIPDLCKKLEEVAAKTYQRGLGAGFFDNEFFRQRFELFARRGLLRVYLLEVEGKPRAFWFGVVYAGVFHSSETGYDPELKSFDVGTLMFIRMVEELSREGVLSLDFGLGDAPYKERFGDRSWRETPAWLFAPTVKGVVMMISIKMSLALDSIARGVLKRTGLTEKIKSYWRRRKARAATHSAAT